MNDRHEPHGSDATASPRDRFHALRVELDAVRAEFAARIGDPDAEYIRAVRAFARGSRVAGRLLIHFSLEPISWGAGVLALATYKVLENVEIGNSVLHGQYDFMDDPQLSSATYEWDMAATARSWKRAHNATHHVHTNVIGRDHDFGYNLFRFSADVPWKPTHLAQPLVSPLSGLFFQYSIGAYDLGLLRRRWYARQVMASSNFEMGRLGHVLSGHLGFQIEHHLSSGASEPGRRAPARRAAVRETGEQWT